MSPADPSPVRGRSRERAGRGLRGRRTRREARRHAQRRWSATTRVSSLAASSAAVLAYLDEVDPAAASVARHRYAALTPWQKDPAAYGHAVLAGRYASSEQAVVTMLRDLLSRRIEYAQKDGERFFDAAQNARVVANAERYYRAMYYGSATSWNVDFARRAWGARWPRRL